jgi:type II secretory pathway pseudopilin PulG
MNIPHKIRSAGFTVIELIIVAVVLGTAGVLIFLQMNSMASANDDTQRKTAINAMYYALEEVYYKQNESYPATLKSSTLPSVDPELFTDPDGFTLGKEALSEEEMQTIINEGDADDNLKLRLESVSAGKSPNYHYDATGCDSEGKCSGYTLRADLVNEAEYVKKNRKH